MCQDGISYAIAARSQLGQKLPMVSQPHLTDSQIVRDISPVSRPSSAGQMYSVHLGALEVQVELLSKCFQTLVPCFDAVTKLLPLLSRL